MQEMNIAIAIDDSFMMPATVMLHSAFSRTERKIHLYLLYSSLSEKNRNKLRGIVERAGHRFTEVKIDEELFKNASLNNNELYSVEIYYRILLPYVTAEDKILWLDSDTIIYGDISELYDHDVSEVYLAAVIDIAEENGGRERIKPLLGIEDQVYFSSGVMLLNCRKIRSEIPQEAFFKAIEQYNDVLHCPDQDILNLLLGNNVLLLDKKYNDQHHTERRAKSEYSSLMVIHYYWTKPWDKDYKGHLANVFWQEALECGYVIPWFKYYWRYHMSRISSFIKNRVKRIKG